jgi:5-formyltetrahydrofolate cyclo-ligase
MEIPALKKSLRREIRAEIRRSFGDAQGAARKATVERKLVDSLDYWYRETSRPGHEGFWAFWPTLPEEPDFRNWLCRLMAEGVPIGLPRLNWGDRILEFRKVDDPQRDLEFDSRGLAEPRPYLPLFEPAEVKRILVPGLAFDRAGRRLGRGAGFYDRTLAGVAATATTVGIAFDIQVVDQVPTDEHDRNVQWLLTPDAGLRDCRDFHRD